MGKVQMGPQTLIYPMPALLVGANVDGKPNFMVAAWGGIANSTPPMISIALQHHRYTIKGIKQNGSFSVNIPSTDLVKETDYCGIVSGTKADKVKDCKFDVFYGKLETAPLIEQCPVNLECEVVHILNMGSHELIVGKVEETHVTETCLTDGKPDVLKINPLIFTTTPRQYHAFGEVVGKAFSVGREIEEGSKG